MGIYLIAMVGLVFDIVGAFLLAAEAIKPHNLHVLRDRWINPYRELGAKFIDTKFQIIFAVLIAFEFALIFSIVLAKVYLQGFARTTAIFGLLVTSVGVAIFFTIIPVLSLLIKLMDFIDHRTEDGGVGIWGFIFIAIGFVMQFTADTIWMWNAR